MRRAICILAGFLLVAAAACAAWVYLRGRSPEQTATAGVSFTASGYVEAEEAAVTAELGGRVLALYVSEGDEVVQGQVLASLDGSLLQAQLRVAESELAIAEATLAQVKAGTRQETLARAEAELAQARVAQSAALVAWSDAEAMAASPQDVELALAAVRGQLEVLGFDEQRALALANSAQAARDLADESLQALEEFEPYDDWVLIGQFEPGQLPPEVPIPPDWGDGEYVLGKYKIVIKDGVVSVYKLVRIDISVDWLVQARQEQVSATYRAWTAWTGLAQAQAARLGLENQLEQLLRMEAEPLSLKAQAGAAESQYGIASAAVSLAEAQVEGLRMGATPEQVAAVQCQVEMARAAVGVIEVQLTKVSLRAPISGILLESSSHAGELAAPGARLLTLGSLDQVTLTVYVPADQLGLVCAGQRVVVSVDAYPGREFVGWVRSVASEAEFTPSTVQTRDERADMVFAVKIALENADHALRPGMPADAEFGHQPVPAR